MIKTAKQVLAKPFTSNFFFIFLQGIIIGLITGLIVGTFRWIIDHTMKFLFFIYPLMRQKPIYLVPYLLGSMIICLILAQVIKPVLNNITGSGVPQVEAIMLDENKMNWWSILWRKFVGGLLAICPGLFLGREGPCIQMGAMVGQAFGQNLFHADDEDLKRLQGCGIAAGLSAAFSAPLAGVFFLVEEITFSFDPKECLTALAAAMTSDLMTLCFFGTTPCLYLPLDRSLPLTSYWFVILMGGLLGLLAYFYQYCLLSLKPIYSKLTIIPKIYHSIIPLILVIPIGLWNAKLLGGSHDFISGLFEKYPNWDAKFNFVATYLVYCSLYFFNDLIWCLSSWWYFYANSCFRSLTRCYLRRDYDSLRNCSKALLWHYYCYLHVCLLWCY